MAKAKRIELLVTAEDREAWQRSANLAGLSLSAYIRRCVDEAQALEHALKRQADDARQAQRRREHGERAVSPSPSPARPRPQQREERMGEPRPWRITIGEALARADRGI